MDNALKKAYKKDIQDKYDIIPSEAVVASRIIADTWIKLGKPQTPFSQSGAKMMDIIIAVWEDLYPLDRLMWYEERKNYKDKEMTISEQVSKKTGRSLASFPLPIYNMMKKVFKGFDAGDKKNCVKLIRQWPMFQMAVKI